MKWRSVKPAVKRHLPGAVGGLLAGLGLHEVAPAVAQLLGLILSVL